MPLVCTRFVRLHEQSGLHTSKRQACGGQNAVGPGRSSPNSVWHRCLSPEAIACYSSAAGQRHICRILFRCLGL